MREYIGTQFQQILEYLQIVFDNTSLHELYDVGLDEFLIAVIAGVELLLIEERQQFVELLPHFWDLTGEELTDFSQTVTNIEIVEGKQRPKQLQGRNSRHRDVIQILHNPPDLFIDSLDFFGGEELLPDELVETFADCQHDLVDLLFCEKHPDHALLEEFVDVGLFVGILGDVEDEGHEGMFDLPGETGVFASDLGVPLKYAFYFLEKLEFLGVVECKVASGEGLCGFDPYNYVGFIRLVVSESIQAE